MSVARELLDRHRADAGSDAGTTAASRTSGADAAAAR
jgi:hypothetical protein